MQLSCMVSICNSCCVCVCVCLCVLLFGAVLCSGLWNFRAIKHMSDTETQIHTHTTQTYTTQTYVHNTHIHLLSFARYICCNGMCPCSGRMGESKAPECCLCLEVRCWCSKGKVSVCGLEVCAWCSKGKVPVCGLEVCAWCSKGKVPVCRLEVCV